MIDFGNGQPALPTGHPFINVQSFDYRWYKSSTTWDTKKDFNLDVRMKDGVVSQDSKVVGNAIWPVRGGQ